MYQLRQTDTFAKWLRRLSDHRAKARILARLESCRLGNLGDTKSIGDGISEMRVHVGPGYRLYFNRHGERVILLLCGGTKTSQQRDIERAKKLLIEVLDEE